MYTSYLETGPFIHPLSARCDRMQLFKFATFPIQMEWNWIQSGDHKKLPYVMLKVITVIIIVVSGSITGTATYIVGILTYIPILLSLLKLFAQLNSMLCIHIMMIRKTGRAEWKKKER